MSLLYKYRYLIAIFYLLSISFLFCLPGSAIPKNDWMSKIWFDKWVHIGFFIALVLLWSWALGLYRKKTLFILLLLAALYGLGVEIVQDQFVPNRAIDAGDWIADVVGSTLGIWLWIRTYIKKIDPCRNRGRNQN